MPAFLRVHKGECVIALDIHIVQQSKVAADVAAAIRRQLYERAGTKLSQLAVQLRSPLGVRHVDEYVRRDNLQIADECCKFRPKLRVIDVNENADTAA